ncbi:MAG: PEP/pyruvate-binding domain-containing protein [Candidatus Woesearchaeota archaeon]
MNIINCEENPENFTLNQVGGKGLNLLKLYNASKKSDLYTVPEFFIIPSYSLNLVSSESVTFEEDEKVIQKFNEIKKPVIVRSSYSLEDGVNATFAGMFLSVPNISNVDKFRKAVCDINFSTAYERVHDYAEKMGLSMNDEMAFIVQQQIVEPWLKGIIQLGNNDATIEAVHFSGREMNAQDLHDNSQGYIVNKLYRAASKARDDLKLDGIVQVEFCDVIGDEDGKVDFVQIRRLPKIISHAEQINLSVPKGAIYIESDVCNGISGEVSLPAYVTASQSGFKTMLIQTGQSAIVLPGGRFDERADVFNDESRLVCNHDFEAFIDLCQQQKFCRLDELLRYYNGTWEAGNKLFDSYLLVCDKLDESISGMAELTSNKKAIITCLEAKTSSHAMTVARDLKIMAMGCGEEIMNMTSFYNQVETGDIVHMKSNGKKAVAYIEKKREFDPYRLNDDI